MAIPIPSGPLVRPEDRGVIRPGEAYTLERLAAILERAPGWVRTHLLAPADRRHRRLRLPTGEPVPGVRYHRVGNSVFVLGRDLMEWLAAQTPRGE